MLSADAFFLVLRSLSMRHPQVLIPVALVVALSSAAPLLAQQSALTAPASSDTIYRLAVDSAGYRQYPFVYLLDDGVVRIESDGRGTERYHQVVQILKPNGVEQWAERQFASRPGHSITTVNWMRVVRPSGELISDKPNTTQESTLPAAMSDPIFSDTKVTRYSLSGVAVGTLVDISWTTETIDPFLKGNFLHSWSTTMAYPALRSRYALDVPSTMTPNIIESHLDFKALEDRANGRHFYAWEKRNSTPVKGEMFAPDSSIPRMGITIASTLHWNDIARWYAGLARDRYVLSRSATAKIDSIARKQRTAADTINALHTWIASDIRYVSIALGIGGYQPRMPDSTIATGLGDCKDKATLFIAAAKHLGLTAYPVLLSSNGIGRRDIVAITQFDHVIAAMPKAHGAAGYDFLDLTTDELPPGVLPPSYQGEFGLVVLPDGKSEEITFPKDQTQQLTTLFEGTVDTAGIVSGTLTYAGKGSAATGMRAAFKEATDSTMRAQIKNGLGAIYPSAVGDSLSMFGMSDTKVDARVILTLHGGEAFKRTGSVAILAVPPGFRGPAVQLAIASNQFSTGGERKYPIDASEVLEEGTASIELRFTLPEGWKAQLPKSVVAVSDFGEYRSEYSQDGRVLRVVHSGTGAKGVLPKERFADFRAWLKTVSADVVDGIALIAPPVP
jgi:hypothetical protein